MCYWDCSMFYTYVFVDSIKWKNFHDCVIMFRLWQGWWTCKGVCFNKRTWKYCKTTKSPFLSETVSDSPAHTWQVCPWEWFHVSCLFNIWCCLHAMWTDVNIYLAPMTGFTWHSSVNFIFDNFKHNSSHIYFTTSPGYFCCTV